jgi:hypothetical protein
MLGQKLVVGHGIDVPQYVNACLRVKAVHQNGVSRAVRAPQLPRSMV